MGAEPRKISLAPLILEQPFQAPLTPANKEFHWTSSSAKTWRTCHRLFYWKYILRLVPKARDSALAIGSIFHEAIGEWYKKPGVKMLPIVERMTKQAHDECVEVKDYYDEEDYGKLMAGLESLRGMLMGYSDAYERDRDRISAKNPLIEVQFRVPIPARSKKDRPFDFLGKIDLISEAPKGIIEIHEHKTTARIQTGYIERLPLDTQVRSYVFGAKYGVNDPRASRVKRVVYDVVRKSQLRRKSNETLSDYTKRIAEDYLSRPAWYFYREELLFNMGDITALEWQLMQTNRELIALMESATGSIPWTDPRAWLPNDNACNYFGKVCRYFTLCSQGLDRGTGKFFTQKEKIHEELNANEED